jgi:hypothetical protein
MHCPEIACTENFSIKSEGLFSFCITMQQNCENGVYFIKEQSFSKKIILKYY